MDSPKSVHTLVLDTGALIRNEPPISTLLHHSTTLLTTPAVLAEIKDSATKARVDTTVKPFLELRTPGPEAVKFVTEFARRTGDLAVLSRTDVQIVALAYEVECERNGGDWRLRRVPGQRRVNGAPPTSLKSEEEGGDVVGGGETHLPITAQNDGAEDVAVPASEENSTFHDELTVGDDARQRTSQSQEERQLSQAFAETKLEEQHDDSACQAKVDSAHSSNSDHAASDSDSGGWITPSNLKKHQAQDTGASTVQTPEPKTMQVAVLTTDFAMQNVILQINLNLLSSSLTRVKHVKTFVLRCHACFQICKDMTKQFCPRCGQPTLTRVSCSTNANGEFRLHLKKNMQWNHRGDRYSIPKAVHGAAHGRIQGGGKGGWGNGLILAEDQKEFVRAEREERRVKERSLMDEDYLPAILTGDRARGGGRVKVGAGRNVNARKR